MGASSSMGDGRWAGASFACHVIEIAFDGSQLINRLCRLSVIDSVRSRGGFSLSFPSSLCCCSALAFIRFAY